MSDSRQLTIFCLASAEKGATFLEECKRQGCYVIVLVRESVASGDWPREAIDEMLTLPSLGNAEEVIRVVNAVSRHRRIDRIVALDDLDVEYAAFAREHLRLAGMSYSTARRFRDKLAMRVAAREHDILVPEFVHALNHGEIARFLERVPPPWFLKPRSEAAAVGIKRLESPEAVWSTLDSLGDRQGFYLIEQFVAGDIYHVDAVTSEREVVFALPSRYGRPPFEVAHEGGIFTTCTLRRDSGEAQALQALNREVIAALGLVRGVTHTEFIREREHGRFYFLETAARIGGAHISDLVHHASGIDLGTEWAKLEIGHGKIPYELPEHHETNAGIIISLARQETPDTSAYSDPEVVWRLAKRYHVGLIVASDDDARVASLLDDYTPRFYRDFHASLPPLETLQ